MSEYRVYAATYQSSLKDHDYGFFVFKLPSSVDINDEDLSLDDIAEHNPVPKDLPAWEHVISIVEMGTHAPAINFWGAGLTLNAAGQLVDGIDPDDDAAVVLIAASDDFNHEVAEPEPDEAPDDAPGEAADEVVGD